MGQYYNAVNIDKKQFIGGLAFGGSKLMEHSYINNFMCNAVEALLCEGNPWHKTRLVWAGDYGSLTIDKNFNLINSDQFYENGSLTDEKIKELREQKLLPKECIVEKKGSYNAYIKTLYGLCKDEPEDIGFFNDIGIYMAEKTNCYKHTIGRFIVNHTKKLYVDKFKCAVDDFGFIIHPLPLLTSDGNGNGGGDFRSSNQEMLELVGSWAGDVISIDSQDMYLKDEDHNYIYTELKTKFVED